MILLIAIGFKCARNLTSDNPLWVRLIVLAPCLAANLTIIAIIQGGYVAYKQDIILAIAITLIYLLLSTVVAGKSWLRIHLWKNDEND